jgi:hypothetical protein
MQTQACIRKIHRHTIIHTIIYTYTKQNASRVCNSAQSSALHAPHQLPPPPPHPPRPPPLSKAKLSSSDKSPALGSISIAAKDVGGGGGGGLKTNEEGGGGAMLAEPSPPSPPTDTSAPGCTSRLAWEGSGQQLVAHLGQCQSTSVSAALSSTPTHGL